MNADDDRINEGRIDFTIDHFMVGNSPRLNGSGSGTRTLAESSTSPVLYRWEKKVARGQKEVPLFFCQFDSYRSRKASGPPNRPVTRPSVVGVHQSHGHVNAHPSQVSD